MNLEAFIDQQVAVNPKQRSAVKVRRIVEMADQGHGRRKIAALTGYPEELVRRVKTAYGIWKADGAKPLSDWAIAALQVAAAGVIESQDTTEPEESEPDGSQWLFSENYTYNADTDTYVTFMSSSPKPLVVPGAKHRAMKQAYSNWDGQPASITTICRTFGMPRNWFNEYRKKHNWTHDSEPFSDEEIASRDVDDLVQDALEMKKLSVHQRYEQRKWQSIKRDAEAYNRWNEVEKPQLLEYIAAHARTAPRTIMVPQRGQSSFAVFASPFNDLHFGKYGSAEETRSPYNRQIARDRILSAVEKLLQEVLRTGVPDVFIIPLGSDLMHIDNTTSSTTGLTRQDTDGTFREIRRGCNALVIDVIDMFLQVAPVHIYPERGNHDEVASFEVGEYVDAWYRHDVRVTVNKALQERQYATYGSTLIGISHGDKSKPEVLARKMMSEARPLYALAKHHVIVTAHLHSSWMNEIDGVLVYRRPCLSGGDIWHEQHAFTGNQPAIMALLIDKERGPYHHLLTTPTT